MKGGTDTLYQAFAKWQEEFMKYANETGSGATKHVPSFMQIGSGIQNLI
jgi:hypothetical protein